MAVISVERYDRVTHKVSPVPTSGVVLATFTDLKNRPCAAVQWERGYLGVSRLTALVKV